MARDAGARLHLIGGKHLDVAQTPEDAARLLWGKNSGDDAHDMGYAALQDGDVQPVLVNPQAVAYVTAAPSGRTTVSFGN
jgi:hypothetical protein